MHRQDITIPLGRRVDMPADAAALAASRVWSVGRMFHASKRLTGLQSTSRLVIWVRTVGFRPPHRAMSMSMAPAVTGRR